MRLFVGRLRWVLSALTILFVATVAHADGSGDTSCLDLSYWLTLLSRIGVPGG